MVNYANWNLVMIGRHRVFDNGIESVNTNVGSGKIVLGGVDVINTQSENK